MKRGNQKLKSSAHENSIAKIFTTAYYPQNDGLFTRTRQYVQMDKRSTPGDIVALKYVSRDSEEMNIDKSFPFSIECKNWKDIKYFVSGLYSKESEFFSWIEQAYDDAIHTKMIPIVVFKLFRAKNIVLLSSEDFYKLANMFGNFPGKFYSLERVAKDRSTIYKHDRLVFFLLKDFLEWIDFEIYKLGGKHRYIRSLMEDDSERNDS